MLTKTFFRGQNLSSEYSNLKDRDVEYIKIITSTHDNKTEKHYFIIIYDIYGRKLKEEKLNKNKRRRVLEQIGQLTKTRNIETNNYSNSSKVFWLGYNEYGKKKKCFSNLSNIKLGLKDFLPDINYFKPSDNKGFKVIMENK